MIQIFLSHNTRDRAWCEWLMAEAGALGIKPYLAEHDVRPGEYHADKIKAAIDASEAVVVLISDNSVEAPYVNQEIGWALKGEKLIIPLVQIGVLHEKLAMLQGVEYIPFDFVNPHEGHAQLTAALTQVAQRHTARQAAKEQRDVALVALACLALVLLTLDS
jgi:TIR domain-containing protein